jgi:hypothetical protein
MNRSNHITKSDAKGREPTACGPYQRITATKILWALRCFPLLVVVALASIHPSQEKCAPMENQGPLSHPLLDF